MPLYDFKCTQCNEEFEVMANISQKQDKKIDCPKCGSNDLDTLYKGFNVLKSKTNAPPACPHMNRCGGCAS